MREKLRGLLLSGDSSNHKIALSLAIGVLVSWCPVYGPQLLLCLLLVIVFKRLNKAAVFLGVQLSWLYPLMLFVDYDVGRRILPGAHPPMTPGDFRVAGFAAAWELLTRLLPVIAAGSVVMGIASGAVIYLAVIVLLAKCRPKATGD
ncbi:MAG: DUF2062 domain-containing protein [Candidatus Aureabacteria bacterium]|nr:DUF2062 domain-containing protein [Candidatus Auribacterota bacterium]